MLYQLILVPLGMLENIPTNPGKYTYQKGINIKMASRMATGSLKWLKLNTNQPRKLVLVSKHRFWSSRNVSESGKLP